MAEPLREITPGSRPPEQTPQPHAPAPRGQRPSPPIPPLAGLRPSAPRPAPATDRAEARPAPAGSPDALAAPRPEYARPGTAAPHPEYAPPAPTAAEIVERAAGTAPRPAPLSAAEVAERVAGAALASEPPRRAVGTRSRAGNAMGRTRAGLLEGALRAVAGQGSRRTTMNDIATAAGVAKATLYNHFRTKTDVWHAVIEAEIGDLAAECAELPLAQALCTAAERVSAHPALRTIAGSEPAVVARMLTADGPGWRQAREAVRLQLAADGRGGTDLVLRWLCSHLTRPAEPDAIAVAAECLVRGLPDGPDPV